MKLKNRNFLFVGFAFLVCFVLWTIAVCFIDRQSIGPNGSVVGFATVNGFIRDCIGVHMFLYTVTDWLGLVPVFLGFGFAVLGLVQLIKRKSLFKVDSDILVLGVFYIIVGAAYLLFEKFAINYRPVLIDGYLEASYPSSTTILAVCVIPTAMFQLNNRIKRESVKNVINSVLALFTVFMVVGRLISGVHWFTDIFGGLLFGVGIDLVYIGVCKSIRSKKAR